MSYRDRSRQRNWGILVACVLAIPLALIWTVIAVVGGSLVCADAAAQCNGVVWPLIEGLAVIAIGAAGLAAGINLVLNAVQRGR